jgi:5-methylthioribose kinase
MRELTPENAADYLRETGRVPLGRAVEVKALGWGVSNVVLRVDVAGEAPFVLKQAREKLRTRALWLSRLDRIWNEREAMELLGTVLPEGTVPRVLFSDEANYLFAMTFAPDDAVVWKESLLAGQVDTAVGRRAGEILGTIHSATHDHPTLAGRLADTTVFDELRIDPFYREIARVHSEIAPRIDALIASMAEAPHRCLVLADFSPKNILVHSGGLTLVDFETAHAGDPVYDLGFFTSHLWLKGFRAASANPSLGDELMLPYQKLIGEFLINYESQGGFALSIAHRILGTGNAFSAHTAACALARVDGVSPVDYLDEPNRDIVRHWALALFEGASGNEATQEALRRMKKQASE